MHFIPLACPLALPAKGQVPIGDCARLLHPPLPHPLTTWRALTRALPAANILFIKSLACRRCCCGVDFPVPGAARVRGVNMVDAQRPSRSTSTCVSDREREVKRGRTKGESETKKKKGSPETRPFVTPLSVGWRRQTLLDSPADLWHRGRARSQLPPSRS